MLILGLTSTDQAIKLGRTMGPEMVPKLQEARGVLLRFSRQAQLSGKLQSAFDYAFRAQFVREALEAYEEVHHGVGA